VTTPCENFLYVFEGGDRGPELGDQRGGPTGGRIAGPVKSSQGVCGHDLGVFGRSLCHRSQLAGEAEHLVFGLTAPPA
jgi:hypothetical protein